MAVPILLRHFSKLRTIPDTIRSNSERLLHFIPSSMISRRETIKDDTHFWVLKLMQDNPGMSQRALAKELGISLGGANYCLQALVDKGWLKMQNFSKSQNKLG
jgi:predicted HTH transcriptional regulator